MDSRIRSWTKSFTWRIIGIIILLLLSYAVTGSIAKASLITLLFHLIRVILYYVHERVWEKISWGKGTDPKNKLPFYLSLSILVILFIVVWFLGEVHGGT